MNNEEIKSSELLQKNDVPLNGKAKDFSNQDFWYYTSLDTLDKILDSGKIWVRNIAAMNDINEAEMHEKDKFKVFALCFCNSNSEKIPMWYLYSGICGNGMRMGLTPAKMIEFIKSLDKVYPVIDNEVSAQSLSKGKDFLLKYGWVFYKKNGSINFKRKWYTIDNYEQFEIENYFIKDYPWEYEKEFRIIFINKTAYDYDCIAVNIPDSIYPNLKITSAPEIGQSQDIFSKNGIKKFLSSKIVKSELQIKMDLLSKNKHDIIKNIDSLIDNDAAKDICQKIQSKNYCGNINGGNT